MRWILDDGPFGHLAGTVDPKDTAHWQADVLLIAGTTAAAATPISQALLDVRIGDEALVATFEIRLGSGDPAEQAFMELHPDPTSPNDLAEHESIAWAQVHGLDAVFVCADVRAAFTALAELGRGRVAHPFDVWLDLRERGWLTFAAFKRLCEMTRKHDRGRRGLPRMPGRVSRLLHKKAEMDIQE